MFWNAISICVLMQMIYCYCYTLKPTEVRLHTNGLILVILNFWLCVSNTTVGAPVILS